MYDRIRKQEAAKSKRDRSLSPHVIVVIVLAAIIIIPFANMCVMMYRYQGFKQDLAQSMAATDDKNYDGALALIVDAGMGKPQREHPETEPVRATFADGATLELWEVAIDGNEQVRGTLIRYTDAGGNVFSYDTDKISYGKLVDALP